MQPTMPHAHVQRRIARSSDILHSSVDHLRALHAVSTPLMSRVRICVGHRTVAGCLIACVVLGGACPDGDHGAGSNVRSDDVVGIWRGTIAPAERADDRVAQVLQFDAPDGDGDGRYGIFHQRDESYGRVGLELVQEGLWRVADGHVVFEASDGSEPSANEILAFSDGVLTLETLATATGRLAYTKVATCPDVLEREGWRVTDRRVMAHELTEREQGFTDIAVDSTGRAHVIAGGSRCEGGSPCRGVGLPTTYFTRGSGCRWTAYSFALPFAATRLVVTPDDTLHAIGRTLDGPFHFSAPAARAPDGPQAWTQVPPGPLAQLGPESAIGSGLDLMADAAGDLWLLDSKTDLTTGQQIPTVYHYSGTWTELGPAPVERENAGVAHALLADDGAGGVRFVAFGGPGAPGLRIYRMEDLTTPVTRIDAVPSDTVPACRLFDVLLDGDGKVHAACNLITASVAGQGFRAAYTVYDGTSWHTTPLDGGQVRTITRRGDGFMLAGDIVWWQGAGGEWQAAGPPFTPERTLEGITEGFGMNDLAAAWDPTGDVIHLAGRDWYATHGPEIAATTTVRVTFEGPGAGTIVSADGRVDCAADCEVEVPSGGMLSFSSKADGASTLTALTGGGALPHPSPNATGRFIAWATGPRLELVAHLDEGRSIAAREFPAMGIARVVALADGGMIVHGAYRAGFAPDGQALTPTDGAAQPYLMRLDAALAVVWLKELVGLDAGPEHFDIHPDGTLVIASNRFFAAVDSADGGIVWQASLPEPILATGPAVALAGGRAARIYSFGTPPDGLTWTGPGFGAARGVVVFGANGAPLVGHHSVDPNGLLTQNGTLSDSGDLIIAADAAGLVAYDADDGLAWTTPLGGRVTALAGDGVAGAWALVDSIVATSQPPVCATGDSGNLYHIDANGRCLFRGFGSGELAVNGAGVAIGVDIGGQTAMVLTRPDGAYSSYASLPVRSEVQSGDVAWSADGTLVAYQGIVFDGSFDGWVGLVRYR